jgi:hypothetical protein
MASNEKARVAVATPATGQTEILQLQGNRPANLSQSLAREGLYEWTVALASAGCLAALVLLGVLAALAMALG